MERRTFLNIGAAGLGSLVVAAPLRAQFIPAPSEGKGKWAVIFATKYGTARDAAVWVSEGMGGIADVFDVRKPPADLAAYDHLVFGSAIQAFDVLPGIKQYVEANASKVKGKVRGLFAVCGNLAKMPGPEQVKTYIDDKLAALTGATSVPGNVFGGRITKVVWEPKEWESNMAMYKQMGVSTDDFDNLKRIDCLKLGAEILAGVKA
ncbi:MAG: flavodoxin domain-containing protein [Acidobacteriota bacterium]|jgi:menaquinone-dependent protoporphyrinogen IX oxidase|nr:flavodoxin domain-containing protein [Acidobacteriota bacterium]